MIQRLVVEQFSLDRLIELRDDRDFWYDRPNPVLAYYRTRVISSVDLVQTHCFCSLIVSLILS